MMASLRHRPLLLAATLAGLSTVLFGAFYLVANMALPSPSGGGLRTLCAWDCGWYASINERGYDTTPDPRGLVANFGFFPAFPIATGLIKRALGLSFAASGVLLDVLLSVLFCWIALAYRSILNLKTERDAVVFLAAFLVSPWSLYNHVPMTEMLFNVSALGTFVFWRNGNLIAAAAFGIVLTATRPTGVILPLALAIEWLYRERHRLTDLALRPDARLRTLAIMPLGLVAFAGFLFIHIGDPLAYAHIQQLGWGQTFGNPAAVLVAALLAGPATQYGAAAFIVASAALFAGVLLGRVPLPLAAFGWLAPAATLAGSVASQPRYALALFPLYLIVPAAPRPVRIAVVGALALGQAVLVYYWLQQSPILV
jgi:hypothetical protein